VIECRSAVDDRSAGGIAASNFWENTIRWLEQEGVEGASQLQEAQWRHHEYLETDEAKSRFESVFAPFAARRTKSYLYSAGQARRVCVGSIPVAGGTQRLPRTSGLSDALLMMLTGDLIDATEALRIGLVSRMVAPEELMSVATSIAR
jgi:Enoyl-CoA hydratase/isomerase